MPKKSPPIEEEVQNIREYEFGEDYDFDPPKPRRYGVSNIVQRVIAHLTGRATSGQKKLKCTEAGILKVASSGSGFEHNDTHSGTAPDTYGTAIAFVSVCSRIDIWVDDNPMTIKRTADGITWDDEIQLEANSYYSFDCVTHSINVKNTTAGSVATYRIVGWY